MYATLTTSGGAEIDRYCFVTSNHADFSVPNGDHRQPHSDIAALFSSSNSCYVYSNADLNGVLIDYFGGEYLQEVEEVELAFKGPRGLFEIFEAQHEYVAKIQYARALLRAQQAEHEGQELKGVLNDFELADWHQELEDFYSPEGLDQQSDWEQGFIHGKLSALRWVLGEEWDFLDT
jgi:hypothetical protein